MAKIIIGLIGEMASGKGQAAEYIKTKYHAKVLRFSDPIKDILNRLGREITRENLANTITALRKVHGNDILAHVLINDLNKVEDKIIVLDGSRMPEEIEALKKIPNFKTLYVTASEKTRFERLIGRNEKQDDKKKNYQTFLKDHALTTEIQIPKMGKKADFKIDNSGTKKDLYKQIDKILQLIYSN